MSSVFESLKTNIEEHLVNNYVENFDRAVEANAADPAEQAHAQVGREIEQARALQNKMRVPEFLSKIIQDTAAQYREPVIDVGTQARDAFEAAVENRFSDFKAELAEAKIVR